jgi:hypothetical protein
MRVPLAQSLQDTFRWLKRTLAWEASTRTQIQGTLIKGDPNAPPSVSSEVRMFFMRNFQWPMMIVATVESNGKPFYVGFRTAGGYVGICQEQLTGKGFCMGLGHEDLTVFAIGPLGDELPITGFLVLPKAQALLFGDNDFPRL